MFNLELSSEINIGSFSFVPHDDNRDKILESEKDGKIRYTVDAIIEFDSISDPKKIAGLRDSIHRELYKIVTLMSFL